MVMQIATFQIGFLRQMNKTKRYRKKKLKIKRSECKKELSEDEGKRKIVLLQRGK